MTSIRLSQPNPQDNQRRGENPVRNPKVALARVRLNPFHHFVASVFVKRFADRLGQLVTHTRPIRVLAGSGNRGRAIEFPLSFARKDGAEPSIRRLSDAGAVPAASTTGTSSLGMRADLGASASVWEPRSFGGVSLMGAKQTRRPADDRSCTRDWPTSSAANHNCEQRQRSRRAAPRGVSEAAFAGHVATEARHSFLSEAISTACA